MKSLILAFALLFGTMFTSCCDGSSRTATNTVDSVEVVTDTVDTLEVDTLVVDTLAVDSVQ